MQIEPYRAEREGEWDEFIKRCPTATFLHSRRFLSYHGDSLVDASLLLRDDKLRAVFPAAAGGEGGKDAISHAGATYGGLLCAPAFGGDKTTEALAQIGAHYKERGFERLVYKPTPHLFCRQPQEDDLRALFCLGYKQIRAELSCAIDLQNPGAFFADRKWSLNKARQHGARVVALPAADCPKANLKWLWELIRDNLQTRHNARPVHSLEQLRLLVGRFPRNILLRAAVGQDGEPLCGCVLFVDNLFCHAQYLANSPQGRRERALDVLIAETIAEMAGKNCRWLSFGSSVERDGKTLNDALYRYKKSFGGGGVVHAVYALQLQ